MNERGVTLTEILVILMIAGFAVMIIDDYFLTREPSTAPEVSIVLAAHGPIHIVGDENFTFANGVVSGSGSELDPYVIENWAIDTSENNGIWIENTTRYFVIRNCLVENVSYDEPSDDDSLVWVRIHYGIFLDNVTNGNIENNIFKDTGYIRLISSSSITISNNTFENNRIGCVVLSEYSNNNILTNNNSDGNTRGDGISLGRSSNNTISNNILSNHSRGILASAVSINNTITNNTLENNSVGILIVASSYGTIANNTCRNNRQGIELRQTENYTVVSNICENNRVGIYLQRYSRGNTIFRNHLLNNDNNANAGYWNGTNYWDNDGEGNYWSDWQPPERPDADNDGIVDDPRPIDGGSNPDNYPLAFYYQPSSVYGTGEILLVYVIGSVLVIIIAFLALLWYRTFMKKRMKAFEAG